MEYLEVGKTSDRFDFENPSPGYVFLPQYPTGVRYPLSGFFCFQP